MYIYIIMRLVTKLLGILFRIQVVKEKTKSSFEIPIMYMQFLYLNLNTYGREF